MKEETKLELEILLVGGLSDPVGGQHEVIVVYPDQGCAVALTRLLLVDLFQSSDL